MMSVVTKYCEYCFYRKTFAGAGMYCDYICMAGRPRPCPAGDGCTVRVLIRREKPESFTIIPKRKRTADMTPEEIAARDAERKAKQKQRDHDRYMRNREKNRERRRVKSKEYYAKNKEKVRAQQAEWRAENREHLAEYARDYRKKQKEAKNGDDA